MKPAWLTGEQSQLREMLHRLVSDGAVSTTQLVNLGIMGATLPEAYGGLEFGLTEAAIIAEALGRARSTAPFIENVIIAGGLIARLGTDQQRRTWLPGIADGSLTIALAFAEDLILDPLNPATLAVSASDGFTLAGTKRPVVNAPSADLLLISARYGNGISLHVIAADALPMSAAYETADGLPAATIELADFAAGSGTLLGAAGEAGAAFQAVLLNALVVQAAEQTGLMAQLINTTIDYLNQRKQFGVALASFQALQHRVADMLLAYEQAVSLVTKATLASSVSGSHAPQGVALSAAFMAIRSARKVGHDAIQLHGGMGISEELGVGPAVKRIYALETRLVAIEHEAAKYAATAYQQ